MRSANTHFLQLAIVLAIAGVLIAIAAGAAHELAGRAHELLDSIELSQPG